MNFAKLDYIFLYDFSSRFRKLNLWQFIHIFFKGIRFIYRSTLVIYFVYSSKALIFCLNMIYFHYHIIINNEPHQRPTNQQRFPGYGNHFTPIHIVGYIPGCAKLRAVAKAKVIGLVTVAARQRSNTSDEWPARPWARLKCGGRSNDTKLACMSASKFRDYTAAVLWLLNIIIAVAASPSELAKNSIRSQLYGQRTTIRLDT